MIPHASLAYDGILRSGILGFCISVSVIDFGNRISHSQITFQPRGGSKSVIDMVLRARQGKRAGFHMWFPTCVTGLCFFVIHLNRR